MREHVKMSRIFPRDENSGMVATSPIAVSGHQIHKMQDKRILGTVGRTLLIAKRS